MSKKTGLIVGLFAMVVGAPTTVSAMLVDQHIAMLVDVSGSIDDTDYSVMMSGYEAAFRDAGLINEIESGIYGSIAAMLVFWSGPTEQEVGVDWTVISDGLSANAFADAIIGTTRPPWGDSSTAPGDAINFIMPYFNTGLNPHLSRQWTIDISGDGPQNAGASTPLARDAALASGINVINAITIGDEVGLSAWYQANVVGGANSDGSPAFVVHASTFAEFTPAILDKLITETSGNDIPEPASLSLLALGALALRRRRRK
jgi:MYXO-CTERM domain-containing protein